MKLADDIEESAKKGLAATGDREYRKLVDRITPALEAIEKLPDAMIDEKPFAIESIAARMARGTRAEKARYEAAKRDIVEILAGPKALTRDEIKTLEANGTDVRRFIREREKARLAKTEKLVPLLVQSLTTRASVSSLLDKYAKLKSKDDKESDDRHTIDAVVNSPAPNVPAPPVPPKPKEVDPAELKRSGGVSVNSALGELFGAEVVDEFARERAF
jgi:hypothetical protein